MKFLSTNPNKIKRLELDIPDIALLRQVEPILDTLSLGRDEAVKMAQSYGFKSGNIYGHNSGSIRTELDIWALFANNGQRVRASRPGNIIGFKPIKIKTNERFDDAVASLHSQRVRMMEINVKPRPGTGDRADVWSGFIGTGGNRRNTKMFEIYTRKVPVVMLCKDRPGFGSFLKAKDVSNIKQKFLIGVDDVYYDTNDIVGNMMLGFVSYFDTKTHEIGYAWMAVGSSMNYGSPAGMGSDPIAAEKALVRASAGMLKQSMKDT